MKQEDDPQRAAPSAAASKRQRIAKLMARAGLCSRRDAEGWIVAGRVSVNGEILTSPALDVDAQDAILVDGQPLPAAEKTRLFLFHKPRGLVTSDHDPEGRPTVADYLQENWPDGPRVVTVGRLDINTEGLLLLTNDGGLARMLELPQTGWVRRYRVRAKGTADVGALEALAAGVTIDGVDYAGIEAKLDRAQGANCWLTMGLREGKNREVKRVLEHVGLEVNRLIRLSFGPFQLLDLPDGAVEEVRTRVLRDQLGPTLATQAGVDFGEPPAAERPRREADRPRRDAERPPARRAAPRPPGQRDDDRKKAARREPPDGPEPVRERPQAGTRKHVGTLRASRSAEVAAGPRKRIERGDTRDRRDRAIAVERLVPSRASPDRPVRRRPGDEKPVREEPRGQASETRPRSAPDERRDATAKRRHASPSAEGKDARRARSGAPSRVEAPRRDNPRPSEGPRDRRGRSFDANPDSRPRQWSADRHRAEDRPRTNRAGGDRPREHGKTFGDAPRGRRPDPRPSDDRPRKDRGGAKTERADRPSGSGPRGRRPDQRPSGDRPPKDRGDAKSERDPRPPRNAPWSGGAGRGDAQRDTKGKTRGQTQRRPDGPPRKPSRGPSRGPSRPKR